MELMLVSGPTGQPYYYNAQTHESTYVRPLPPPFAMASQMGIIPGTIPPQPEKKKEKPKTKTPIPGTEWLRVTTTEGNVFYTHKVEKRSVWTVPEEIADAVAALEEQEQAAERAVQAKAAEEIAAAVALAKAKSERDSAGKRKAEEAVPVDELVISKKAKVEDENEDDENEDGEDDEDEESEEEDWQREAAAQLAAEAEEQKKRQEEERKREEEEKAKQEAEMELKRKQLNIPDRVDLSIDEAKALFKVCDDFTIRCASLTARRRRCSGRRIS